MASVGAAAGVSKVAAATVVELTGETPGSPPKTGSLVELTNGSVKLGVSRSFDVAVVSWV